MFNVSSFTNGVNAMKFNMKFNKRVLIALVLLIGAIPWAVSSVVSRSYSGTNLNFEVGSGPVTVTNPSDASVPVQLIGGGTRSYSVSSTIEARVPHGRGNGKAATYLFELAFAGVVTYDCAAQT
jgi:hypothetical protein